MTRVLVVDDEPTVRSQISEFLMKWNFKVSAVGSLAEANREMAAGDVRVLVQDLVLRGEPGDVFEFIRRYCGPGTGREAIAMTGYLAEADLRRVVDAGAFCFFKKPVDLDELLVATWAALERAERTAERGHRS